LEFLGKEMKNCSSDFMGIPGKSWEFPGNGCNQEFPGNPILGILDTNEISQ